jgi:hypothetical protein
LPPTFFCCFYFILLNPPLPYSCSALPLFSTPLPCTLILGQGKTLPFNLNFGPVPPSTHYLNAASLNHHSPPPPPLLLKPPSFHALNNDTAAEEGGLTEFCYGSNPRCNLRRTHIHLLFAHPQTYLILHARRHDRGFDKDKGPWITRSKSPNHYGPRKKSQKSKQATTAIPSHDRKRKSTVALQATRPWVRRYIEQQAKVVYPAPKPEH